uniref:Uncharacterized protein n=1 Tax=Hyaloperonospora arabidopsidis (strain Emoy2) TaxID=559515 RepID=M4BCB2_HYAAE
MVFTGSVSLYRPSLLLQENGFDSKKSRWKTRTLWQIQTKKSGRCSKLWRWLKTDTNLLIKAPNPLQDSIAKRSKLSTRNRNKGKEQLN